MGNFTKQGGSSKVKAPLYEVKNGHTGAYKDIREDTGISGLRPLSRYMGQEADGGALTGSR